MRVTWLIPFVSKSSESAPENGKYTTVMLPVALLTHACEMRIWRKRPIGINASAPTPD